MGSLKNGPAIKAEIVSDPTVMSGDPVGKGTRVPAETIIAYLRGRFSKTIRACRSTRSTP